MIISKSSADHLETIPTYTVGFVVKVPFFFFEAVPFLPCVALITHLDFQFATIFANAFTFIFIPITQEEPRQLLLGLAPTTFLFLFHLNRLQLKIPHTILFIIAIVLIILGSRTFVRVMLCAMTSPAKTSKGY